MQIGQSHRFMIALELQVAPIGTRGTRLGAQKGLDQPVAIEIVQ
jgi:hypothetical protein